MVALAEPLNPGDAVQLREGDEFLIAHIRDCMRYESGYRVSLEINAPIRQEGIIDLWHCLPSPANRRRPKS